MTAPTPSTDSKNSAKPRSAAKSIGHAKVKLPDGVVLMAFLGSVESFSHRLKHNVRPGYAYCMDIQPAFTATRDAMPMWQPLREEDARLIEEYGRQHGDGKKSLAGGNTRTGD